MSPTQNASFLAPFRESPEKFQSRPRIEVAIPELRDGEWEWEVNRIADSRGDRRGNWKFLVFWVGHPTPQWIPMEELKHAKATIWDYYDQRRSEIPREVHRFLGEGHPDSNVVDDPDEDLQDFIESAAQPKQPGPVENFNWGADFSED